MNEYNFGMKVGLEQGLSLSEACADFYVLEDLENVLTQQRFYDDSGRLTGPRLAKDFGRDVQSELRAQDVIIRLAALEERLAKELALYIFLACGGELRHIVSRLDKGFHKRQVCNHGVCDGILCGHGKKDRGDAGCLLAKCQRNYRCWERVELYTPSPRIQKYLVELDTFPGVNIASSTENGRGFGWEHWYKLAHRSPVVWLKECADAFNADCWYGILWETKGWIPPSTPGYGGPNWATAASLASDYYAGVLRPRTFLDRCWSLQHNSGSLFNKFYRNLSRLSSCLAFQAANDYTNLATYCSSHVALLWWKQNNMRPFPNSLDVSESADYPSDWPFSTDMGCLACYGYYYSEGVEDPCSAGTPSIENKYCAYINYAADDDNDDFSDDESDEY